MLQPLCRYIILFYWCPHHLSQQTSTLNREMDRIQGYCQRVAEQITAEYRGKAV